MILAIVFIGMIAINSSLVTIGYEHVNAHADYPLLFTDLAGSVVYRGIYFLLPINPLNYSLWFDESRRDGSIFLVLTVVFFVVSIFTLSVRGFRFFDYVSINIFFLIVSAVIFDSSDIVFLIFINFLFYTCSFFLLFTGFRSKKISFFVAAIVAWCIPNLYQVAFLAGLYI